MVDFRSKLGLIELEIMLLERLCQKFHGSSWNIGEDVKLKNLSFYTHILNEYAKEEEEKNKKKMNKMTDWPTGYYWGEKVSIYLALVLHTKWL